MQLWCTALVVSSVAGEVPGLTSQYQELTPSNLLAAAAAPAGGFGVEAERGQSLASEDVSVSTATAQQMPMTDLEAEVQRTSRVAAYLAQDAAVLSKELQSLQMSLRGHARLDVDPRDEASGSVSAVQLADAPTAAAPAAAPAAPAAAAPAAVAPAPAAAASAAPGPQKEPSGATPAGGGAESEGCGAAGQTPCSPANKIITFDYRFPIGWGLLNWVLIVLLSFLFAWCCCACCLRGPRANTR